MSLINQMLQDLEQRREDTDADLQAVTTHVRAAPAAQKKSRLPMLLGLGLCGALAWLGLTQNSVQRLLKQPFLQAGQANVLPQANATIMPAAPVTLALKPVSPALIAQASARPAVAFMAKPLLDRNLSMSFAHDAPAAPQVVAPQTRQPFAMVEAALTQQPTQGKPALLALNPVSDQATAALVPMEVKPAQVSTSLAAAVPLAATRSSNQAAFSKHASPEQQALNDYQQALSSLQLGRVAEALDMLRKSLEANPNNHEVRQTLIGLLVENQRRDEAMVLLKAGLKIAPEQSGYSQTLARLQLDSGQRLEALSTLEKGLPYAGNDSQYHGFLAVLLQRAERHNEAIQHYQTALNDGSNLPAWLVGLGVSLQAQGRLPEAQAAYSKSQHTTLGAELAQFVDQRLKQIQQQSR
ncbi:MAG: tetratricopeptide repeat protein [Methylophilaceae bacterium]